MLYEIINPSDPYTMAADDVRVARCANIVLSEGCYALRDEEGKRVMPIMLADDTKETEAWLAENIAPDTSAFMRENASKIADVLDSITLGGFDVARKILALPQDEQVSARAKVNAKHTSLNNISGVGQQLAAQFRSIG